MSIQDLQSRAIQIRDEILEGRNTAHRVGQLLLDMISMRGIDTDLLDRLYLRKDRDDVADGNLTFNRNLTVHGLASLWDTQIGRALYSDPLADRYGTEGFFIPAEGPAWLRDIRVKGDAQFAGAVSSPDFVSGFLGGIGYMLAPYERINAAGAKERKYRLELDDLTVRGKFRVFEMIYSQLRGENDNVVFAAMMKVDHVDPETGTLYLDTEGGTLYNPFRPGDILMAQRIEPSANGGDRVVRQYELRVTEAGIGNLADGEERVDHLRFADLVGDLADIRPGDTLTRADSVSDSTRKGIIKVTTIDEFGAPYIDVLYGMKTDPMNATRMRAGRLDGLVTPYWGRLRGYGLMCDNAYLKGRFLLQNGQDVLTRFEIVEGKVQSEISAFRVEVNAKDNYLANASFAHDTEKWEAASDIAPFTVAGRLLMPNEAVYAEKRSVAAVVDVADRRALRLKGASAIQRNADLARRPERPLVTGDDTAATWPTFYVSFKYRCDRAGTLRAGFEGKPLWMEEEIGPTDGFETKEFSAEWDGTGDFSISFTGDIYIHSLALSDDPLENHRVETATRFYQTDSKIGMLAEKASRIEGSVTTLGIDLDAMKERIEIFAKKVTETTGKVTDLGLRMDAAESRVDLFAKQTDTLSGQVKDLGIDIDAVRGAMHLFAIERDITGSYIMSKIEMAPSNVKLSADRVDLEGKVSFSALSGSLENYIRSKANLEDLRSKANVGDLKSMAYQDKVSKAMLDSTIIEGGFIKTSLIKVDDLFANQASIGGFDIKSGQLYWMQPDYFGNTSRTLTLGLAGGKNQGVVDVFFNGATDGLFGVKAHGRGPGSAAIYGSSNSGALRFPDSPQVWAGFFDGYIFSEGYFSRRPNGRVIGGRTEAIRMDNSDTWLIFCDGIYVGYHNAREVKVNIDSFNLGT